MSIKVISSITGDKIEIDQDGVDRYMIENIDKDSMVSSITIFSKEDLINLSNQIELLIKD